MGPLAEIFFEGWERGGPGDRLAAPEGPPPLSSLRWMSGETVLRRVAALAAGLRSLGLEKGDRVGLLSENRPEWFLADWACHTSGLVVVPLYPTLAAETLGVLLADAEARTVLVSGPSHAATLRELRKDLPRVETLVGFEEEMPGVDLTLAALEERGHAGGRGTPEALRAGAEELGPGDLASLVYTSGTTGRQKGVMLTQANLAENIRSAMEVLPLQAEDRALSFLPLSHIFERTVDACLWRAGARIIHCPHIEWVAGMLRASRPTFFAGVPRLYEKIHMRVLEEGAQGAWPSRAVFRWGLRRARARSQTRMRRSGDGPGRRPGLLDRLAERLVWRRIRRALGGRVRLCLSGGAPLRREICEFFWGIGVDLYGGYGLTEAAPILTTNHPGRIRCDSVGPALPGVELRIGDGGEVLARGPNIMEGYWRNPEATGRALVDGWLRTGDLGRIEDDGHLVLLGRRKEILVTSGGKNVAPVPVEEALKGSDLIEDAMMVGDGRRFVAVLVVPSAETLPRWAEEMGMGDLAWDELLDHDAVRELYRSEVQRRTANLSRHERPKKTVLLPRGFLFSEGELTATGKVRRTVVAEHFADIIEDLYRETPTPKTGQRP